MLIFKIVCIYYIICNGWDLYFMYYEIPVPWVHHNLCNGMECSKHSMVKSPYLFSTCNMDAGNIKFLRTHKRGKFSHIWKDTATFSNFARRCFPTHELFEKTEKLATKTSSIFVTNSKKDTGGTCKPPKADFSVSYALKKQNNFLLSSNVLDINFSLHI